MIVKRKPTVKLTTDFDSQIYKFNFNQDAPTSNEIIYINQKKVLSLGGLIVLTGKPKARKSTFLHTFIGSQIKQVPIFDIYTNLPAEKSRIVLIDTEQSNYDLYKSINRLSQSININIQDLSKYKFDLYSSRLLSSNETIELIDDILKNNPDIGLLCIDSLIDLVDDINDVTQSKTVIQKIKYWLDNYKIGIISVIHQAKSTNYSLGHLGSFASRFCQSELAITKNEDNTSTIAATYMRSDENFNPISIQYDDYSSNYIQVLNNIEIDINTFNHKKVIDELFLFKDNYSYKDLLADLRSSYAGKSNYWLQNTLIPFLYNQKYIVKSGNNIIQVR